MRANQNIYWENMHSAFSTSHNLTRHEHSVQGTRREENVCQVLAQASLSRHKAPDFVCVHSTNNLFKRSVHNQNCHRHPHHACASSDYPIHDERMGHQSPSQHAPQFPEATDRSRSASPLKKPLVKRKLKLSKTFPSCPCCLSSSNSCQRRTFTIFSQRTIHFVILHYHQPARSQGCPHLTHLNHANNL